MNSADPDGSEFRDASVVEAYRFRPPIPDEVLNRLETLIPDVCPSVLDAGCGTGVVARRLARVAQRIDAIDPSSAMIEAGKQAGVSDNIRWIVGTMEEAETRPPYGLIVCAGSLHWMDLDVVMPRFAADLHPRGALAIVSQYEAETPWAERLEQLVAEYSTNHDQHRYGLFLRIVDGGYFRPVEQIRTEPVRIRQSISEYIESLHSRSGLSRDRMSSAEEFDARLGSVLAAHAMEGTIAFDVIGRLTWGRPVAPVRAVPELDRLIAIGIGLEYNGIRLERTTDAWLAAGAELRSRVERALDGVVSGVEAVGSSSVLNLLAKPIIDLAAGLAPGQSIAPIVERLQADGWIYRGDAGSDGGHVFVLESRPWHRVAHLHAVEYNGPQWQNYLRFRDLLRRSPEACERYEAVKLQLADERVDRRAYTTGKTDVVTSLLED
ncbi:MAG TPA: GrpB family protein [Mycobacteriales bacterium]|nr:GrpB family protein [Mycobacteriales bacterium]